MIVIKRIGYHPLDHDRTTEMRSVPSHHSRYNAFKTPCAFWSRSVVHAPRDRRTTFHEPNDPTHRMRPRHLHLKHIVWISPTRNKLKDIVGFIIPDGLEDLNTLPHNGRPNFILYIWIINIIIRRVGAAWARVALPRGLECHVASTWDPRKNINHFCIFKCYF